MPKAAYDALGKRPANHVPLTPVLFLERAAATHPERLAIVHGAIRRSYGEFGERARRLASALLKRGVQPGDTVAVLLPNTPAMLECHFGVPLARAVLNTMNTRLDAGTIAYTIDHGEARVMIVDREFVPLLRVALAQAKSKPLIIEVNDPEAPSEETAGGMDYEALLAEGDPAHPWSPPEDEWDAISLNYTSGTTGRPKGVVYHHRGAYLAALGNIVAAEVPRFVPYLWTLPMFHCNGWCFPWAITAVSGTHVCLRAVRGSTMWELISEHSVQRMCGAPIVLATLLQTPAAEQKPLKAALQFSVAGAPPPEAILAAASEAGVRVNHIYGLTEVYGPATVNEMKPAHEAAAVADRAKLMARQGVRYVTLEGLDVIDPATMQAVPPDGETMGEVMFRGNMVMKGYLKDSNASDAALAHGWFHSGDLAVKHADGYVQLKDRSKDIIISGGENISSIEVEEALFKHPAVALAAVVAMPDEKWGERPCAFVELKPGASATEEELIAFCRDRIARYKVPARVLFAELPRTSTGKIQKHVLRTRMKEGAA
jgi:fatty-acyl-CoA synthase